MLNRDDFVNMLTDMETHLARAMKTLDGLITDLDDTELRLKLVALRQNKQLHLEAMNALTSVIRGEDIAEAVVTMEKVKA